MMYTHRSDEIGVGNDCNSLDSFLDTMLVLSTTDFKWYYCSYLEAEITLLGV